MCSQPLVIVMFDEHEIKDKDEFVLDEINGSRNKRTALSTLNKRRVSKFEMDELFNQFE